MADPGEIRVALKTLRAAYPGNKLTDKNLLEYACAIEDIPGDILQRAVQDCIRTSPWFPRISELYHRALQIGGVLSFDSLVGFSYRSLLAEQVELQAAFARGEPLDESAWLSLAGKFRQGGFYLAYEHTLKRLSGYKQSSDSINTSLYKEYLHVQERLPD